MEIFENFVKMYIKILFIYCLCVLVDGNEVNKFHRRKGRSFTFNAENDDLTVSIDFTVPVLTIPGKKSIYDALTGSPLGLPTININPASLALGGALILGSTILMPLLVKNYAHEYPEKRFAKLLNDVDFNAETVLNFANEMLKGRNLYGCSQRIACWSGQSVHNGETFRIWNQIMSNQLLTNIVNTTAIAEAMSMGRTGHDCMTYTPCPLQENHLPMLMKNFGLLT